MQRCLRFALGLAWVLTMSSGTAHAQGWGWGGWGGWAETPGGSLARGMGYFAQGLGQYNLNTAQANSINTDTYMRWNEYWYQAHLEGARRHAALVNGEATKTKAAYNEYRKNLQDHPTAHDVESGDALNAALDQLNDPRISSSSLKIATAPVDAAVIKDIPFHSASEAVTIVLNQVKTARQWPSSLNGDRFIDDKKTFEEIAEKAPKEDEVGDISPDTLKKAHDLVNSLKAKLAAEPLATVPENQEANRFVKTLSGLVRMLEKPDTKQALDQLKLIKSTTVGNLLAFMHVYNLRFGPATTPRQRLIYDQIFPVLDDVRDRVMRESKVDESSTAQANPNHVDDFFNRLDVDQAATKDKKAVPVAPNPNQ
jgi:hypothetical protein